MKFEKELEKAQEIVDKLESGDLGLEESIAAFEQGMKSLRSCESLLKKAETRIRTLVDDKEEDFVEDDTPEEVEE